jgi:hypothetical protein
MLQYGKGCFIINYHAVPVPTPFTIIPMPGLYCMHAVRTKNPHQVMQASAIVFPSASSL